MKNLIFVLAFLVSFAINAQSIVEVTYLDTPAAKIGRFVELHKEMVESMNSESRTNKGHWVYRHWYGSGAAIVIYDVYDSAEDAVNDNPLAALQANVAKMSPEAQKEMSEKFQEWWSHYDGHWDEMRTLDFENFHVTQENVDWDKPFVFVAGQYNVENIAEAANAYMDWQIRPGVAEGSIMGGGVSSHFKGSGLDIEVYQSYESLVDFAKHVENGSGGNAEARVKFWTNVQGQHSDQIYLHIGHMENGVFNLAGADR